MGVHRGKRCSRVEMHLDDKKLQRIQVAIGVKLSPVCQMVIFMTNTERVAVMYLREDHTWHF